MNVCISIVNITSMIFLQRELLIELETSVFNRLLSDIDTEVLKCLV